MDGVDVKNRAQRSKQLLEHKTENALILFPSPSPDLLSPACCSFCTEVEWGKGRGASRLSPPMQYSAPWPSTLGVNTRHQHWALQRQHSVDESLPHVCVCVILAIKIIALNG